MSGRKIKSIKNIYTGLTLRVTTLGLRFLSRYIFIRYLGEECLGLNGLFSTILTLFSLADLGIGEAITFYLYKPISERDSEKLCQLVTFYKHCYRIIGITIWGIGIVLMPFLPHIVRFDTQIGYNIYLIYFLYLINTVFTYLFFSYPQTVLIANQEQYIVNKNTLFFTFVIFLGDFISLIITKNYIVYLVVHLILSTLQNVSIYCISRKKYEYIVRKPNTRLCAADIKGLFRDVYSICVVKLASRVIDSTDNIFISIFLGTIKVGVNSNYLLFGDAATSIIYTIIYAFSASIGDFNVSKNKSDTVQLFRKIDFLNFSISFFCAITLFSLLNPLISLLWGEKYTFSLFTVAFFCFNFYIVTSMYVVFMFRQSLGLFKYQVYNNVFAAILNIALDFLLVRRMDVAGLYLATIISNLIFAVWPFVKNVFNVGFGVGAGMQIKKMIFRYIYVLSIGAIFFFTKFIFVNDLYGFICRVLFTFVILIVAIMVLIPFEPVVKDTLWKKFKLMK